MELVRLTVLVPASVLVEVLSKPEVELVWLTVLVPGATGPGGSGKSGSSGTCLAYGARARLRARTGASS